MVDIVRELIELLRVRKVMMITSISGYLLKQIIGRLGDGVECAGEVRGVHALLVLVLRALLGEERYLLLQVKVVSVKCLHLTLHLFQFFEQLPIVVSRPLLDLGIDPEPLILNTEPLDRRPHLFLGLIRVGHIVLELVKQLSERILLFIVLGDKGLGLE